MHATKRLVQGGRLNVICMRASCSGMLETAPLGRARSDQTRHGTWLVSAVVVPWQEPHASHWLNGKLPAIWGSRGRDPCPSLRGNGRCPSEDPLINSRSALFGDILLSIAKPPSSENSSDATEAAASRPPVLGFPLASAHVSPHSPQCKLIQPDLGVGCAVIAARTSDETR
jgi:hypothetical protein